MKKAISLLVATCMIFSCAPSVFAVTKDIRDAGTVDYLVDNVIFENSENIRFIRGGGVTTADNKPGVLVYRSTKVIRTVGVYTDAMNSQVKISAAADGSDYQTVYASASGGKIYSGTVPGRNYILRIEFESGVIIDRVEINTVDNFGNVQKRGKVLVDYFEDFSKMHYYTPGLGIDSSAVNEVNGDQYTLWLGRAPDKANIVYKLSEEIAAFKLLKFCGWSPRENNTESILKFYLSPDNSRWTELDVASSSLPTTGLMMESQEMFELPAGNFYLKIEWNGAEQSWSPRLGTLEIYYGPQPEGSIKTFNEEINEQLMAEAMSADLDAQVEVNPKGMEFVTIPTVGEVIENFNSMDPKPAHPRLLANKDDFDRIRNHLEEEPYATWYENVKRQADELLTQPPAEFILQNRELIVVCRIVKDRILRLGMMWQMTNDAKYAERAWQELEAVSNFPNWNPQHFLDVGEMTFGVSIGYDWLYDYWSSERKEMLKNTILKHGINVTMPFMRTRTGNTQSTNNWNGVCIGGVGTGAIVLFEEEPELCAEYISIAIEVMPKAIAEMYPDGVYPEGLTYWDFGTRYTVYFMTGMDYTFGTNYGLTDIEGFKESGDFILYASSPSWQTFTFSDAGGQVDGPQLYWMARKFNKPQYSYFQYQATGDKGDVLDLVWYDGDYYKTPEELEMPLDRFFDGETGVAAFRNSWEDKNALYVAVKAGDNQSSHGDIDIGTFVLDSEGMRWAVELSAESYDSPGYWTSNSEEAGRWTYYKKRAEGQNTLVINPDQWAGQDVFAKDRIERFETGDGGGFAVVDMSNAYNKNAVSAKRGVKMYDGRSKILIQDELDLKNKSEVWWFMQAAGDMQVINGGRAVLMSSGAKRMKVSLITPGTFQIMPRNPLPTSPASSSVNNGLKLAIHLTDVTKTTIGVVFEPVVEDEMIAQADTTPVVPLAQWSAEDTKIATLDSLSIDGIALENFKPNRFIYTIPLPKGIEEPVQVQGTASGTVSIRQAQQIDDKAIIEVSEGGLAKGRYTVIFEKYPLTEVPEDIERFFPISVSASDEPQPENSAKNSMDGDLGTRWSAEGEQWLQFDLGEQKELGAVTLGIFNGDNRKQKLQIQLSTDDNVWTTVLNTESCGLTVEPEIFQFETTTARYVRILCTGTDSGTWNSITEFAAYKPIVIKRSFTDIEKHWAKDDIEDMASDGVVKGISALIFAPDETITRAEYVAMLVRALGLTEGEYSGYADVAASEWYASAVQTAKHYGLIIDEMTPNGQFSPGLPIDRETMAVMGALAARVEATGDMSFDDAAQISQWAVDGVNRANQAGIVTGDNFGNMNPKSSASRAEATAILKRISNIRAGI